MLKAVEVGVEVEVRALTKERPIQAAVLVEAILRAACQPIWSSPQTQP